MSEQNEKIQQLYSRLERLSQQKEEFTKEIEQIKKELDALSNQPAKPPAPKEALLPSLSELRSGSHIKNPIKQPSPQKPVQENKPADLFPSLAPQKTNDRSSRHWEKLIGENIISKIGMIITVIGLSIFVKYAIEHELMTPLTRIVLGYLAGFGLLGFALKLKVNYHNYSAVLVSGALATLYFVTYSAHTFYSLLPQPVAFGLMFIFTGFAIVAALNYNRQVIAHLGLTGAYAIPFLFSSDPDNVILLFSYMAIINTGILVLSALKNWKSISYVAFGFTWFIYLAWRTASFQPDQNMGIAFIFLLLFFLTFYLSFISYKFRQQKTFVWSDIIVLLLNVFLFYGIGLSLLADHSTGQHMKGLFTVGNALIHFVVSIFFYQNKQTDRNLFFLLSGLVLVFITLAILVQFDGNWITLLWSGLAVLIFWIGRSNNVSIYENLSYPIMALVFISLLQDWASAFASYSRATDTIPLLNMYFLTSIVCVAAFYVISLIHKKHKPLSGSILIKPYLDYFHITIWSAILVIVYVAFYLEMSLYWTQQYLNSTIEFTDSQSSIKNENLLHFGNIWLINYFLIFFSVLAYINMKTLKNTFLGFFILVIMALGVLSFLLNALPSIELLRISYLNGSLSDYYDIHIYYILIRYISLVFVILAGLVIYLQARQRYLIKDSYIIASDVFLVISLLWLVSSELYHWLDMADLTHYSTIMTRILWGVYSLLLVAVGIWKKKKHLRYVAFIAFGLTLFFIFLDIWSLGTLAITILLISSGILLLLISFLYHKYKHVIFEETDK